MTDGLHARQGEDCCTGAAPLVLGRGDLADWIPASWPLASVAIAAAAAPMRAAAAVARGAHEGQRGQHWHQRSARQQPARLQRALLCQQPVPPPFLRPAAILQLRAQAVPLRWPRMPVLACCLQWSAVRNIGLMGLMIVLVKTTCMGTAAMPKNTVHPSGKFWQRDRSTNQIYL